MRRVNTRPQKYNRRAKSEHSQEDNLSDSNAVAEEIAPFVESASSILSTVEKSDSKKTDEQLLLDHPHYIPISEDISKAVIVINPIETTEILGQENLSSVINGEVTVAQQQNVATNLNTAQDEMTPVDDNIEQLNKGNTGEINSPIFTQPHQEQAETISVIEEQPNPVVDVARNVEPDEKLPSNIEILVDILPQPAIQKLEEESKEGSLEEEGAFHKDDGFNIDENIVEASITEDIADNTPESRTDNYQKIVQSRKTFTGNRLSGTTKKARTKHTNVRERDVYYGKFIDRRLLAPLLTEQEIDAFLMDLQTDNLVEISNWPPNKLENYLFHALQRFEVIGELPVSNLAFTKVIENIRTAARQNRKLDQKLIPPVIYLVSMVFCARYSESDARDFWKPYANMVWGLDEASLSFQQKCRKHFINCREDLHQVLNLSFNYHNIGDVVRPVYQHAIIPSYLQGPFAEWLVDNFEALLQYSAKQLPLILQNEKSLDYMPRRLRDFIRSEETKEAAARLITRMSNAVKLFHETEQTEAVESVMSSSIERSLWEVIYKKLINDQTHLVKLRRITPRLEWHWDLENEEIFLNLSNIRSDRSEKPDSVTWSEKDANYLKGNDILVNIYPWKMRSGDWEVDPVRIPPEGPLDGNILVLSEDFELDKDKHGQYSHIVFERTVPPLQKPVMFFRVNPRRNIAVQKEQLVKVSPTPLIPSDIWLDILCPYTLLP